MRGNDYQQAVPELENLQVVNRHTFTGQRDQSYIYIGRGTPLGNNWSHVAGTQAGFHVATREEAIDQYRNWLWNEIKSAQGPVVNALTALKDRATQGEKLNLACSCHPEACHGDVIKSAIEHLVQQDKAQNVSTDQSKSVFVSGSRSIDKLSGEAAKAIEQLISQNAKILIGDAPGTDALVQQYLHNANYDRVQVFHVGAAPRNNAGFPTVKVDGTRQTDKDAFMAAQADTGLAIWDGKSPGTKENIARIETTVIKTTPEKEIKLSARAVQAHSDVFSQDPTADLRSLYNVEEGLTRGQHASELNKNDQFTRESFERGATINDSILSIPRDPDARPLDASKVTIGTEAHAIDFVKSFIDDPKAALEKGQRLFQLADKACGQWSDSHGRLTIFTHLYDAVRKDENGKYLSKDQRAGAIDKVLEDTARWVEPLPEPAAEPSPEEIHANILALAEENRDNVNQSVDEPLIDPSTIDTHHALYLEELRSNSHGLATLGELSGFTLELSPTDIEHASTDENQLYADLFEEGASGIEFSLAESDHLSPERQPAAGYTLDATFDRINLDTLPPAVPERLTAETRRELTSELLPRIDAQIEHGFSKRDILSSVYQTNRANEATRLDQKRQQLFAGTATPQEGRPARLLALSSLRLLVAAEYKRETKPFTPAAITWAKDNYHMNPDRLRANGQLKVGEYAQLKSSQDTARSAWLVAHPGQQAPTRTQIAHINSLEIAGHKINDRIQALTPSRQELAQTLDSLSARLQTASASAAKLLNRYETADAAAAHLSQAARQYADSIRASSEFTTLKAKHDHNQKERALDQRQELIRGNSARFDYLQGAASGEHSSQHAEVKWTAAYDARQESETLTRMLISPEIQAAQAQLASELDTHARFFTQIAGREVSTATEAKEALHSIINGFDRTTEVASTTRGRYAEIPPNEINADAQPAPIYVSLAGSEAVRIPVGSLSEYEALTTTGADCRLHTSAFSSFYSPTAITGRDEERQELAQFIANYIDFRQNDHTTGQLAHKPLFRDFSQRLSDTRSAEELVETAISIRTENYQLYQQQQAHNLDPKANLAPAHAPLSVRDMRELFLSINPIGTTKEDQAQMTAVLHSMTVFGQEKTERIKLLAEGKIQPSATLVKLLANLGTRNTKPALNHFYLSLRNPADTLAKPNTFDLYKAHRSLPQYERDYLHSHALAEKYAAVNGQSLSQAPATAQVQPAPTIELSLQTPAAQTELYREYYGQADWNEAQLASQAQALNEGISPNALNQSTIVPELTDHELRAISYAAHNYDADQRGGVIDRLSQSPDAHEHAIADMIRLTGDIQDAARSNDVRDFTINLPEGHSLSPESVQNIVSYVQTNQPSGLSPDALSKLRIEAQRNAWAHLKESAIPQHPSVLAAPASTFQNATDVQRAFGQAAQLQDRARDAHQLHTNHIQQLVSKCEQAIAQSSYRFIDSNLSGEQRADITRSLVTATLDNNKSLPSSSPYHQQAEIVRATISEKDLIQARDFQSYAATARTDYHNSINQADRLTAQLKGSFSPDARSISTEITSAKDFYAFSVNEIETSALTEYIADSIRHGRTLEPPQSNLQPSTVRDLIPHNVQEAAHSDARAQAWQSFVPPELQNDQTQIDERIISAADALMDQVAASQTLQLHVDAAQDKLNTFINEQVGNHEAALREEKASTAFENKFRDTLAEIKNSVVATTDNHRADAAGQLLSQLEQASTTTARLVTAADKQLLQPLETELIQTANAAATDHAREAGLQPIYQSAQEQTAAHDQIINGLSGRDAARYNELSGQVRAIETKYNASFNAIDTTMGALQSARDDIQIEQQLEQFRAIAKPASVAINNYLKDTIKEEGYAALLEPMRHDEHIERIAATFKETALVSNIALSQPDEQLTQVASHLFAALTPVLEHASEQAHTHDLNHLATFTNQTDFNQPINAQLEMQSTPNGQSALAQQTFNAGLDRHQPTLPGDVLHDLKDPSAATELPANSPATHNALTAENVLNAPQAAIDREEMAIAL